ncbi:hypothetical protein [Nitrosomonas sp. Nm58]|uniref:hypothetical protein n=1 Tax=Nitrosomonas sp. Nm58 TaxID=200126 RepID=UPI001C43577A|nr:hypothetical protein [Nitrosomonas sp. Nm58]
MSKKTVSIFPIRCFTEDFRAELALLLLACLDSKCEIDLISRSKRMNRKASFQAVVSNLAIATALLIAPLTSYATEQGEQRREARDIKQDARQKARETKAECKAGDEKSRAECRQDKRETKQDARKEGQDIKY